jgi:hypothetical protein
VAEHGPFATEQQALATRAAREAAAAFRDSPGAGRLAPLNLAILTGACQAEGVELGAFDLRILAWLASYETSVCVVIAGLIRRASRPAAAGGCRGDA